MAEDREVLLTQIGLRIIRRREALGWTQKHLAQRLGIAPQNIHHIEHGKQNLTVDTLLKLAEALGTTGGDLFTGLPHLDAVGTAQRSDVAAMIARASQMNHLPADDDPDVALSHIGIRIVRRREALGMTRRALAGKIGMAEANLARIEHGEQNLTIRTMCRLTIALEMTLAELITGT